MTEVLTIAGIIVSTLTVVFGGGWLLANIHMDEQGIFVGKRAEKETEAAEGIAFIRVWRAWPFYVCSGCRVRVRPVDQYRHAMWHQKVDKAVELLEHLKLGHNSLHKNVMELQENVRRSLRVDDMEARAKTLAIEIVQTIGRTP